MAGVMKKSYHYGRIKRMDLRYRLDRRMREVEKLILKHFKNPKKLTVLDIGTADGLMLSKLNKKLKFKEANGIDMSKELLEMNKDKNIKLSLGNAEDLKFRTNSIDVIIATAVIEHVDSPMGMLKECYRVLKKGGIVILTTPNPFFDEIATKIGYLADEEHLETLTLKKLAAYMKKQKFKVVRSRHFMFFPFFRMPFEDEIETSMRFCKLGPMMTNQLIAGKK